MQVQYNNIAAVAAYCMIYSRDRYKLMSLCYYCNALSAGECISGYDMSLSAHPTSSRAGIVTWTEGIVPFCNWLACDLLLLYSV